MECVMMHNTVNCIHGGCPKIGCNHTGKHRLQNQRNPGPPALPHRAGMSVCTWWGCWASVREDGVRWTEIIRTLLDCGRSGPGPQSRTGATVAQPAMCDGGSDVPLGLWQSHVTSLTTNDP